MEHEFTISQKVLAYKVDGVPLVAGIVEGDACSSWCGSFCVEDETDGRSCRCDQPVSPPADLVALSKPWDGQIVLAGDKEFAVTGNPDNNGLTELHDGRLMVDVQVECETDSITCHCGCDGPCAHCDSVGSDHPGYRTVKGLVDVVPVVETRNHGPHSEPPVFPCLTVNDQPSGRVVAYHWHHDAGFRTLTPAHVEALGKIEPGMWAWTFTDINQDEQT